MRGSLSKRARNVSSRPARMVATASLTLLLLFCEAAHVAHGWAFVPVVHNFAVKETTASVVQSRLVCQEGGGYIAAEPTALLHQSVVQTVRAAGAADTWYTFLGGDSHANAALNCPKPIAIDELSGASYGCYWRWNQGRWTEMDDARALPLYIGGVGVTFFIGNTYKVPLSSSVTFYGQTGGFPIFFDTAAVADRDKRPGMLFGKNLVAVGKSDTSTWSDNLESGGYSYAGYTYNSVVGVSRWNADAQTASKADFWTVCQAQTPSRTMYELENTSSGLQENWWVIFFVILFVVMLVVFFIIACCQDDEDMDEPPEDAPVWAQEETQQTKRTKSFVSTRSFRRNDYGDEDDDDDEGARCDNNNNHRRGSTSSDANNEQQQGGFRDCRRGSDDNYKNDEEQQQQQQDPRGVPNTAGSHRQLGRQNGSTYNMPQSQLGQPSQNGYANDGNINQSENNWM